MQLKKFIFIESNEVCLYREYFSFIENNPNLEIIEEIKTIEPNFNLFKIEIEYVENN